MAPETRNIQLFSDKLTSEPTKYRIQDVGGGNDEEKEIEFIGAVSQAGTKNKAEYFNNIQESLTYKVGGVRAIEGSDEKYDISITGSTSVAVFEYQFLFIPDVTNTHSGANSILRFNSTEYTIKIEEGESERAVIPGDLIANIQYYGWLDHNNGKVLFSKPKGEIIYADATALKAASISEGSIAITQDNGFTYDIVNTATLGGITIDYDDELHIELANGKYAVLRIDATVIERAKNINDFRCCKSITKLKYRQSIVQINCYGDSTTFGTGTDVATTGDPTYFGDGSTYPDDQISDPYPKQLEAKLEQIYGSGTFITVKNMGYSGSRVSTGYHQYRNLEEEADFSIFMWGLEDAKTCTDVGLNPVDLWEIFGVTDSLIFFKEDYKKFLVRHMLRGNNVILALPINISTINLATSVGFDGTEFSLTRIVAEYRKVAILLGEELGIEVIDVASFFDDYDIGDITTDDINPNTTGYEIIASRLSSIFIGDGYKKPTRISGQKTITATNFMESMDGDGSLGPVSVKTLTETYTPHKIDNNSFLLNLDEDKIAFPIYCEHDETIVYCAGINLIFELDFAVAQGQNRLSLDAVKFIYPSTQTLGAVVASNVNKHIVINGKGWHVLTIEGDTSGEFYAFQFGKQAYQDELELETQGGAVFFASDVDTTSVYNDFERGSRTKEIIREIYLPASSTSLINIDIDIPLQSVEHSSSLLDIMISAVMRASGNYQSAALKIQVDHYSTVTAVTMIDEVSSAGVTPAISIVANKLRITLTFSSDVDSYTAFVKQVTTNPDTRMTDVTLS